MEPEVEKAGRSGAGAPSGHSATPEPVVSALRASVLNAERWKGPQLFTYFAAGHVIVRWRRFDFLFHWPSRLISLILWRWHQPHGSIFHRAFGFTLQPWYPDIREWRRRKGVRVGSMYLDTFIRNNGA